MAVSLTCTDIRRSNGKVHVRWSDGQDLEFRSLDEARAYVRGIMEDVEVKEFLRAVAIAKYLTVDPTGANPSLLIGRTITADLNAAANLVRIA